MVNSCKGLVLEVNQDKVVILTRDGCFLEQKYKGKAPEIGQEIAVKASSFNWKALSMIGIAALLALIIVPFLTWQAIIIPQVAVAYVTVDINPSLELGLNEDEKVIIVQPLNTDGSKLANKLKLKNLVIDEALELITEAAIKDNYISSDKENTVLISYSKEKTKLSTKPTITTVNSMKKNQLEEKVKQVVERNQQKAVVEIIHVSSEIRNKASELGLSTGKYTLILEAWDEGVEISPESVREKSIANVIKEAGGDPKQIITHLKQKNLDCELGEELSQKHYDKLIKSMQKFEEKIERIEIAPANANGKNGKNLLPFQAKENLEKKMTGQEKQNSNKKDEREKNKEKEKLDKKSKNKAKNLKEKEQKKLDSNNEEKKSQKGKINGPTEKEKLNDNTKEKVTKDEIFDKIIENEINEENLEQEQSKKENGDIPNEKEKKTEQELEQNQGRGQEKNQGNKN